MLTIRLQRVGRKRDPSHRIVVQDSRRHAQSGRVVEILGSYNPQRKQSTVNAERVSYWIQHGAGLSDTVHNLMINKGVIQGQKKNALPRKTPQYREVAEEEGVAPAQGAEASKPAEEAPQAPTEEGGVKEEAASEEAASADSSEQEPADNSTSKEAEAAVDQEPAAEEPKEETGGKEATAEAEEETVTST